MVLPIFNKEPDRKDVVQKTRALLAFRTITTILSRIQSSEQTTENESNLQMAGSRTSKELDALTAIAVRRHGIAAVVAEPCDLSGTLRVLASLSTPSNKERLTIPQSPSWKFSFITNLSKSATKNTPIIIDPDTIIPQHLKACKKSDLLQTYLTEEWPKRSLTDDESFNIHMWMIKKLLGQARRNRSDFLLYIIASCYSKMRIRMDYRISHSIRNALKNPLATFNFSEQLYKAKPIEADNDHGFLSTLLKYKPHLKLETEIPNLTHQAETPGAHHNLYTENTCMEFHLLLSELLERFSKTLDDLDALYNQAHWEYHQVFEQLMSIARFGSLLCFMTKGAAIKKHLKVIEGFLPDRLAPVGQGESDGGGGDQDQEVVELDQDQTLSKWQRCNSWLQLMVIHFDSEHILTGFLSGSDPDLKVNIKILSGLVPLHLNMLPWKDLLKEIGRSHHNKIISFLETYSKVDKKDVRHGNKTTEEPVTEDVVALLKALDEIPQVDDDLRAFGRDINHVICQIENLLICPSSLSEMYTPIVVAKLESLMGMWNRATRSRWSPKITNVIKALRANAKLCHCLRKYELDTGTGFRGSYHCEAGLAAFCHTFEPLEWSASNHLGVSQPCCPVCAHLLNLLSKPRFTFTSSHNTISACSLPEWLPMDVITAMISKFGRQLMEHLIELKDHTEMRNVELDF